MISLRVIDPTGAEVPVLDGVLELEEHRHYQVRLPTAFRAATARLGALELPWSAAIGGFPINLGFEVGSQRLRIEAAGEQSELRIHILPAQEKLSEDAWLSMLQDLDAWLPGLSVGLEGARHGEVSHAGVTAPFLAESLVPLLPALERTFRAVLEQPRQRTFTRLEDIPIRQARRVDRESLIWLGRHPAVSPWLQPWVGDDLEGPEPSIPQRLTEDDFDHPANRYLAWLILRVIKALGDAAKGLRKLSSGTTSGDATSQARSWSGARASSLERGAERLDTLWRRSFLRHLRPQPPSEAALLVVLDDPLYARAHRLGRLFLSPRFQLEPEDSTSHEAAIRPSFHLYELWCFLALQRLIAGERPHWKWRARGQRRLFSLQGTGTGAIWRAHGSEGTLRLHFNPTFPGWFNRKGRPRWSLSTERRPDLVVTWAGADGHRSWISLDAKYRAGQRNLGDALSSAHLYRDSLRWPRFGGPCRSSILLAPAADPACAGWFALDFRSQYGIGIERLTPGRVSESRLGGWVLDTLNQPQAPTSSNGDFEQHD